MVVTVAKENWIGLNHYCLWSTSGKENCSKNVQKVYQKNNTFFNQVYESSGCQPDADEDAEELRETDTGGCSEDT